MHQDMCPYITTGTVSVTNSEMATIINQYTDPYTATFITTSKPSITNTVMATSMDQDTDPFTTTGTCAGIVCVTASEITSASNKDFGPYIQNTAWLCQDQQIQGDIDQHIAVINCINCPIH